MHNSCGFSGGRTTILAWDDTRWYYDYIITVIDLIPSGPQCNHLKDARVMTTYARYMRSRLIRNTIRTVPLSASACKQHEEHFAHVYYAVTKLHKRKKCITHDVMRVIDKGEIVKKKKDITLYTAVVSIGRRISDFIRDLCRIG